MDNNLHNEFMILVNNTPERQKTYRGLAEAAMRDHANDEGLAASSLANVLKERFEWMVDDVNMLSTLEFPRLPGQVRGNEDDPHQERVVMVQALILHAFGQVNWLGFAKDIISELKETIRWQAEHGGE